VTQYLKLAQLHSPLHLILPESLATGATVLDASANLPLKAHGETPCDNGCIASNSLAEIQSQLCTPKPYFERQPIRKLALQLQQLSQKYLKGFGVTSMQGGFTP